MTAGRSLRGFRGDGYDRGRPFAVCAAWWVVLHAIFPAWWLPSALRPVLLRAFGATVGARVRIRSGARVHWPWKLTVGDDVWIGEDAWLINMEHISIGHDVCISQRAVLCGGSHLRNSPTFEFDNGPIDVEDEAWIAIGATVLRGVRIGRGAVVGASAVVDHDVPDGEIVRSVTPDRFAA